MQEPIVILYDNSDPEDEKLFSPFELDVRKAAEAVEQALKSLGRQTLRFEIQYDQIAENLRQLCQVRSSVFFNLCEDIRGQGIYEVYVAALLELLGATYTGSEPASLSLCLDKARSKEVLAYHGLSTPHHYVLENVSAKRPDLSFPLILKPLHEDGSLGIDANSVVLSEEQLAKKAQELLDMFHQPVIVEEYIGGREFNVSLLGEGPDLLPISEIDYSKLEKGQPHILTHASKWEEDSPEYHKTPAICPAALDRSLEKTLNEMSLKAFRILGCRDYARVDIRMRGNQPCIIEVNPNPAISPDAGFVRSAQAEGLSYAQLIGKIVSFAEQRKANEKKRRKFQDAYSSL